jgi:Zn-finger protein
MMALPAAAQAASVSPTTTTGNPGCADLNPGWSEFKIDRVPTNGTYTNGAFSVVISNVQNQKTFDWAASQGVDAVLVKASTDSYIYNYDPEASGDTGMDSPGKWAISHVSFCYDGPAPPPPPQTCDEQHAGEADSDDDGKVDACDNCPSVMNPDQTDSDQDGTGDACEPTPTCDEQHAGEADSDDDGKVDACDNCPSVMNPDQADSDHDGTGDACEPPEPTCEELHTGEADSDGDGKVDACDETPTPPTCGEQHAGEADTDQDGVVDACDNCPSVMNPEQTDSNGDGVGDACEPPAPGPSGDQQQVAGEQQQPASEPGDIIVLGERVSSGTARMIAADGCASRAFSARVRGTKIARVVFTLDGKRLKTVTKPNRAGAYSVRVNPAKLRIGVHRIVATVRFKASARTAPKKLRATFQRCGSRLVSPQFTG